jgi:hypothetical protein
LGEGYKIEVRVREIMEEMVTFGNQVKPIGDEYHILTLFLDCYEIWLL